MKALGDQLYRIAGLELNGLRVTGVLGDEYEKLTIPRQGTPIYDLNGELLFYRLSLKRGRTNFGYADIAVH